MLVFSILVPYRDFKELLPQVVAQGTCFVTFYICKIVCVLLVMCPSREKKNKRMKICKKKKKHQECL